MYTIYRMVEEYRSPAVKASILKSFAAMSVDLIAMQIFYEV